MCRRGQKGPVSNPPHPKLNLATLDPHPTPISPPHTECINTCVFVFFAYTQMYTTLIIINCTTRIKPGRDIKVPDAELALKCI